MCSNSNISDKIFKTLLWIGTKMLIVLGTFSFLVDVGTDVSFSVQLFSNCHVKTGIASICVILVAIIFSMMFPTLYARNKEESCWLQCAGYVVKFLHLSWKEFIGNDLGVEENMYLHSVKFIESIFESVPQIGISFYIIHHYGFDDPVFTKSYRGDLQMLSLFASIVSINISMATRRAWWKMLGKPPSKWEIFKCFLRNLPPISCFLVAYCIIMADSSHILIIFTCISPVYWRVLGLPSFLVYPHL